MFAILINLTPEVLILLAGFALKRAGWISNDGLKGVAKFAFGFAIPVLLFNRIAFLDFPESPPWDLWLAYFGSTLLTMVILYVAAGRLFNQAARGKASLALGSTFSNTVMIGLPFHLGILGPNAAYPVLALIALHVLVLVSFATLLAEWKSGSRVLQSLAKTCLDAVKNPIIIGLMLGLGWNLFARLTGAVLPEFFVQTSDKLGSAALPVALFALGGTLAGLNLAGDAKKIGFMLSGKLLLHPLIVILAVVFVFDLPPMWEAVCILNAFLPTGMNGFIFAAHYEQNERSVAGTILISTLISVPIYAYVATLYV